MFAVNTLQSALALASIESAVLFQHHSLVSGVQVAFVKSVDTGIPKVIVSESLGRQMQW